MPESSLPREVSRPTDWLGSPKSGRPAYKIKSSSKPANVPSGSDHGGSSSPSKAGLSASAHEKFKDEVRKSSHAPDPEKYKAILRNSYHPPETVQRSDEFLGDQRITRPFQSAGAGRVKPKWGAGESKSVISSNIKGIQAIDLGAGNDDAPQIPRGSWSSTGSWTPKGSRKTFSTAVSLSAERKPKHKISRMTEKEHVDRKKFIQAFSAFEGQEDISPVPSGFAHSPSPTPGRRNFKVSTEAKARNALISSSHHTVSSHDPSKPGRDLVRMNNAIIALRKYAVDDNEPAKESHDQHASAIVQMLTHLKYRKEGDVDQHGAKTFLSIVNSLRRNGVIQTQLDQGEVSDVMEVVSHLDGLVPTLDTTEPYRLETEVCARILHQVSTSSPRSVGVLEDVIGRLNHIRLKVPEEVKPKMSRWIKALIQVDEGAKTREQGELSEVIGKMDDQELSAIVPAGTQGVDEVTRVLAALDEMVEGASGNSDFAFGGDSGHMQVGTISPRGREPTVSPKSEAIRNFKISSEAKAKSLAVSMLPMDMSAHSTKSEHEDHLQSVILNLRKVVIPKKNTEDRSEQQANEIIQMMHHLRTTGVTGRGAAELYDMIDILWDKGLISSNLGPNRMSELNRSIEKLEDVRKKSKYSHGAHEEMSTVVKQLKRVTPTSAGAIDAIQPAIGRLKKIMGLLHDAEQKGVEDVISRLEAILNSMKEGQEQQLADAIRKLDGSSKYSSDATGIMSVLGNLGKNTTPQFTNKNATVAKARLTPFDADFLVRELINLKKARMSHRQAFIAADTILELDVRQDVFEEKLDYIQHQFKSSSKAKKVIASLRNLRQLNLNEHERLELATIAQNLGRGKQKMKDELIHALGSLRKLKLTQDEVREVVNIMSKLGKSSSDADDAQQIENALKKMAYEKGKTVSKVYKDVAMLDLTKKEARKFVLAVGKLGLKPLTPSEYQLFSTDFVDGSPILVLHIPDGEEYAKTIREFSIAEHISKTKQYKTREFYLWIDLDPLDDDSDEFANPDDSDYESESESESEFESHMSPAMAAQQAQERFRPDDADSLVFALIDLKKAKMSHREAACTADMIELLGTQQEVFDQMKSDLAQQFKSKTKAKKVLKVLKVLRSLDLNEHERLELATIVRNLGTGKRKTRKEITDALVRLQKTKLTPKEAQEVAGIMFNLRKRRPLDYDINSAREMKSLRKVIAEEKADVVAETYNNLNRLELTEKEIDNLVAEVRLLGVEPLGQNAYQLISADFVDGHPVLVLNIPNGEKYANAIEKLAFSEHISKKKSFKTREFRFWIELDPANDSDEVANRDGSDCESESDDASSPSPQTPIQSPTTPKGSKKLTPKTFRHYAKGQADAAKLDRGETLEHEKRIRYSNKHHWKHNRHHNTVVSEKRWRYQEDFNYDEVVWSPLRREQHERRKTVGAAILKTMDKYAPVDDMVLDELQKPEKSGKKKKKTGLNEKRHA